MNITEETGLDLAPPSKDALSGDAQTWAAKARGLRIQDAESCRQASYLLRSIKGVRAEIQRWFEPHVEAAMETKRKAEAARKQLVDEQTRMEAPLVDAEGVVKRALLTWEAEQERARLAEEARLQAEAQAHAEAVTLAVAASLELDALATGDPEMLAEAQSILEQPIEAPAVAVARQVPKVQGVTYRDNWKAHPAIDIKKLAAAVANGTAPITFLLPNLTAINQWARATQGSQTIAGVRVFNDRQIASRG